MSTWAKLRDLANDVNSGKTSASELVEKAYKLLAQNEEYKTVISKTEDLAKKRAKQIDEDVKAKKNVGKLAGIPFIAKDNFLVFGSETTAASNILKGFNAPYQSTAINKLEAEGAICIAKANLDAFGHGASTENSDFFTTLNPKDKTRVPGGSSGGSAAAVALNIVPFSIATDTGGSIRLPANFCGVVGYKPTYGLVSRSGVIAMASSSDTIGVLANNVEDTSLVMEIMSGKDPLDSTTIELEDNKLSNLVRSDNQITIGIAKEYFAEGLHEDIKKLYDELINKLDQNGIRVKEISIPSLPLSLATYYILIPAEISSNLSRYDGQRFGYYDPDAKDMEDTYLNTRSKGFGAEAKRRIMIGTYVLSSGYYDAYYKKAQTVRTKLINEFHDAFKKVDFLLAPTSTAPAFKIGENVNSPLAMYLNDILTAGASLAGIPTIDLPFEQLNNLPVGMQIMGAQKKDKELLSFAKQVEDLINV
jgi:aspartyl-tRNA(Asn)/glutamyl-tRNA(Gln) amidotransferase subunit A